MWDVRLPVEERCKLRRTLITAMLPSLEFESTQVAKEVRNVNKRHALNNANLQSW